MFCRVLPCLIDRIENSLAIWKELHSLNWIEISMVLISKQNNILGYAVFYWTFCWARNTWYHVLTILNRSLHINLFFDWLLRVKVVSLSHSYNKGIQLVFEPITTFISLKFLYVWIESERTYAPIPMSLGEGHDKVFFGGFQLMKLKEIWIFFKTSTGVVQIGF